MRTERVRKKGIKEKDKEIGEWQKEEMGADAIKTSKGVRDQFCLWGWGLLPEYFIKCLPENQVVWPEYYFLAGKWPLEWRRRKKREKKERKRKKKNQNQNQNQNQGGGGAPAPTSTPPPPSASWTYEDQTKRDAVEVLGPNWFTSI